MTLVRYRAARPLALRWGQLIHNFTGYSNNVVLLDGPGRRPAAGSGGRPGVR